MVQQRHRARVAWGILLAIALLAPSLAQAGAPAGAAADRTETELRRTDALLDRARDEVAGVSGTYAHQRLRQASEIQRDAWLEFGDVAPDLRRVVALTQEARKLALKAIEAAGIERRAHESVRGQIDRAETRAQEVAVAVQASGGTLPRRLLESALQQLRRAREAWAANDPRAARQAALALSLIERAARAAAGASTAIVVAEASIDRAEALLGEVDSRLAEAPAAAELAALRAQAGELLEHAREALRRGAERPALRGSLQAREIALRLLARLQQQPSAADLLAALDDLEALLGEIAPAIETSGNLEARERLRLSREQMARARSLMGAGQIAEAVAALAAAEALLREAADAAGVR